MLGIYAPTMLLVYEAAGRVAFGLSLLLCAVVGGVGGLGPGLVAAIAVQGLNVCLANRLQMSETERLPSVLIAFTVSSTLAAGTAGLRNLVSRIHHANLELSAQVEARANAEAILKESLALYQSLVSSMGEGVGVFDRDDCFVFANEAAERIFGTDRGALLGQNIRRFLTDESMTALAAQRVSAGEHPRSYDLHLNTDPPRSVMVTESWIGSDTPDRGRILRVLRDITARLQLDRERRELELHLQRTEALQSLAVLAGGVAHDFNNLLSGVLGNTDLALLRLQRNPQAVHPCLVEIRQFATEASELSRHMLTYAGRRTPTFERVDIASEVREALRLLESTARTYGTLRSEVEEGLPPVHADRVQLRQVVTNLVLNALEALVDLRGTVVISASFQRVSADSPAAGKGAEAPAPGDYVVLRVSDNGVGMSEATLAKIFEPFFSTKFTGRGMGLAATFGIIRAHSGGITVSSRPGEGTTFRVYLPTAAPSDEQSQKVAPAAISPSIARSATVLVVDDEDRVRAVTSQLLAELGCTVHQANSGPEALETFATASPAIDLVLLDLTMPGQNGLEVLAALRQRSPSVRVVLTSGFGGDETVAHHVGPGVVGFLSKPHTLAGLRSMLNRGLPNSC